jgi:hypothetical protein
VAMEGGLGAAPPPDHMRGSMSKLKTFPFIGSQAGRFQSGRSKALRWLGATGLGWLACIPNLACVPSNGPGPQRAQREPAAPPVEAVLRAAPPTSPAPLAGQGREAAPSSTAPQSPSFAAVDDSSLECVDPPDPELDKESPWSHEIGQRLERALPGLEHCSLDLAPDDTASITLRFVYAKDGSPTSQHVVTSTSNACSASDCLKQELGRIRSPALYIDKASIDLTLSLAHGAVPARVSEPVDPLTPEEAPVSASGCVDPEVARLSQAAVRGIVSDTYDELQRCYGEALTRDHSATGKVTFEFVIGQSGAVADAWARDATLHDCAAISCMLGQFRGLNFPEPVGRSVRVIYPINYVLEQQPVTLR